MRHSGVPDRAALLAASNSGGRVVPSRAATGAAAAAAGLLLEPVLVHAPKRRVTVLLLCLLLGWLGCHRFYVGKGRTGRLYLLTGGLLFVGVIVDLVLIGFGLFEDRFGQPLV